MSPESTTGYVGRFLEKKIRWPHSSRETTEISGRDWFQSRIYINMTGSFWFLFFVEKVKHRTKAQYTAKCHGGRQKKFGPGRKTNVRLRCSFQRFRFEFNFRFELKRLRSVGQMTSGVVFRVLCVPLVKFYRSDAITRFGKRT